MNLAFFGWFSLLTSSLCLCGFDAAYLLTPVLYALNFASLLGIPVFLDDHVS